MVVLQLPLFGRHDTRCLVRQIDARLAAQPQGMRPFRDRLNAQPLRQRVVVGVAGVRDGVVDIDSAMVCIARKVAAVEGRAAGAVHLQVLRDMLL